MLLAKLSIHHAFISYNAAIEIAVEYFINKQIRFTEISEIVSNVLQEDWCTNPVSFEEIIELDFLVRKTTENSIKKQIRKLK